MQWEKRSLHEFGHMPIERLADRFDFIIIDHPWAGHAFREGLVRDLFTLADPDDPVFSCESYVGESFNSYVYEERLLALPVDCATPIPSWRQDLLDRVELDIPTTLEDVIALADRGWAAMPAFPADLFLNWSMLLDALEADAFTDPETIAAAEPAMEAMDILKRLAEPMPDFIYATNPIQMAERMTGEDSIVYCPFAYSYNNYSRPTFTKNPLRCGNLVKGPGGARLRSILGGTGIAISRSCRAEDAAMAFARYVASASVQSGIYTMAGGQPAYREAWESEALNSLSNGFFERTRQSHQEARVRPRYPGYVPLQEQAGIPLQAYLQGTVGRAEAWEQINAHYRASRA